ncbi:HopJ type III effector protein [Niabella ginsengisoli]|uniref:HopJ type III effector protein n=1 Tax=Niabella ginsengisoli TaxID=522298 RepID=A0ABS9SL72_9BACT|nr:HopJ type III effector protein [Niabella ginsengisoli]MCH5599137.1 HopJ type III effector protein [Niabella ginsengisoli]
MAVPQDKIKKLINKLEKKEAQFLDTISFIETYYVHTPTAFTNGAQLNGTNENQGSAKVFTFAKLNDLSKEETLKLFAEHYDAVLSTPTGNDHQNIRQFILHGWQGIAFNGLALKEK